MTKTCWKSTGQRAAAGQNPSGAQANLEAVGERKPYDEITVEGELEIQFPACTAKFKVAYSG